MSPLDEKFRQSLEKIYLAWRETVAAAFARGIKAGKVRKDVSPRKVAAFIVAAQAGMAGTAKKAPDEGLLVRTGQALFHYLGNVKTEVFFYDLSYRPVCMFKLKDNQHEFHRAQNVDRRPSQISRPHFHHRLLHVPAREPNLHLRRDS